MNQYALFSFENPYENNHGSSKKNPPNKDRLLYHHALVKLIILHKLEKSNQAWDDFFLKEMSHLVKTMQNTKIL